MNFEDTEDRRMLAQTLHRYLADQYGFEARMKIAQSQQGFSLAQWASFSELGILGALFDERHGGFGGGGFDITVVFEAIGRHLVVEPFLTSAILAGSVIAQADQAHQQSWLSQLQDGSAILSMAHDEPDAHYELSHVSTRAEPQDGGWRLNGRKSVVSFAQQANALIVSARTGGQTDDETGISLFLVPMDTPGVSVRSYPLIDGGQAAEITLDQVQLPSGSLIGFEGQAFAMLEHAVGRGVLALCAEAVGVMEAAKQATIEYLQTRKQFGVPIGSFQALQHRMADVLLEIEQARSSVINAAAALDGDRVTRERALSAAKHTIGRVGTLVAEECIQLHGGIGMTWELPVAHYAKRLVMIDHQLGDEDHHLARFISLASH